MTMSPDPRQWGMPPPVEPPPPAPPYIVASELRDPTRFLELGADVVEAARRAGRIVHRLPAEVDPVTRQPRVAE